LAISALGFLIISLTAAQRRQLKKTGVLNPDDKQDQDANEENKQPADEVSVKESKPTKGKPGFEFMSSSFFLAQRHLMNSVETAGKEVQQPIASLPRGKVCVFLHLLFLVLSFSTVLTLTESANQGASQQRQI
jgi:hypothetical protein